MGLRERLGELVFGPLVMQAAAGRIQESSLAEEDRLWRSISNSIGTRDLQFRELMEEMNDAALAYRINPLAYRLIELTVDFVLGRGMSFSSPDPDIDAFVQAFWNHPLNHMDTRQNDMLIELCLSGDLFVTLHTNPYDGMSYVRLIPAVSIDKIETDPNDLEAERRFHRVGQSPAIIEGIEWDQPMKGGLEGLWFDASECRHYAVNRMVGAVRGQGDLTPMLPWLRRYKDWLTDRVRINKFKSAFLWDVVIAGADKGAIVRRQGELANPPEAGSVLVHNEKETWKAVQPMIDAAAVEPDGKAMRLMVAAGAGIPLHYLAESEGGNRGTAKEMTKPAMRHYERRQRYFSFVLQDLLRAVIERSGKFAGREIELIPYYEDIFTDDKLNVAQSAKLVADGLAAATEQGWLDKEEARKIFARFIAEPLTELVT